MVLPSTVGPPASGGPAGEGGAHERDFAFASASPGSDERGLAGDQSPTADEEDHDGLERDVVVVGDGELCVRQDHQGVARLHVERAVVHGHGEPAGDRDEDLLPVEGVRRGRAAGLEGEPPGGVLAGAPAGRGRNTTPRPRRRTGQAPASGAGRAGDARSGARVSRRLRAPADGAGRCAPRRAHSRDADPDRGRHPRLGPDPALPLRPGLPRVRAGRVRSGRSGGSTRGSVGWGRWW